MNRMMFFDVGITVVVVVVVIVVFFVSIDRFEEKKCELKVFDDEGRSLSESSCCLSSLGGRSCRLSKKSPFVFWLRRVTTWFSKEHNRPPGEIQNCILCLRSFDTFLSNRDGSTGQIEVHVNRAVQWWLRSWSWISAVGLSHRDVESKRKNRKGGKTCNDFQACVKSLWNPRLTMWDPWSSVTAFSLPSRNPRQDRILLLSLAQQAQATHCTIHVCDKYVLWEVKEHTHRFFRFLQSWRFSLPPFVRPSLFRCFHIFATQLAKCWFDGVDTIEKDLRVFSFGGFGFFTFFGQNLSLTSKV